MPREFHHTPECFQSHLGVWAIIPSFLHESLAAIRSGPLAPARAGRCPRSPACRRRPTSMPRALMPPPLSYFVTPGGRRDPAAARPVDEGALEVRGLQHRGRPPPAPGHGRRRAGRGDPAPHRLPGRARRRHEGTGRRRRSGRPGQARPRLHRGHRRLGRLLGRVARPRPWRPTPWRWSGASGRSPCSTTSRRWPRWRASRSTSSRPGSGRGPRPRARRSPTRTWPRPGKLVDGFDAFFRQGVRQGRGLGAKDAVGGLDRGRVARRRGEGARARGPGGVRSTPRSSGSRRRCGRRRRRRDSPLVSSRRAVARGAKIEDELTLRRSGRSLRRRSLTMPTRNVQPTRPRSFPSSPSTPDQPIERRTP